MKRLVVNADDFGFARDVNAGIVEAHSRGILTAATIMANGAAFDDAVRLARQTPSLDVGCHLVLVQGCSAMDGTPLPETLSGLVRGLALGRVRPYEELRAQVLRILEAGIIPTHLDTHKHTHLAPPVLDALARLAGEFKIPWVRRPFDFPMRAAGVPWTKTAVGRAMGGLRGHFQRVLDRHGCRATDHFAGFGITGRFRTAELVELLRALPEGLTEFMCHPGFCSDELLGCRTRLKQSREEELRALTSPEARRALDENGIRLVNYRSIG